MGYERDFTHPTRPRRTARGVVLATAVVALVCLVGATGLGLWNYQSVRGAREPARQVAEAFLGDLVVGDAETAYDRLCAATRDRWQRLEFVRWIGGRPALSRYAIQDVSVATRDGRLRGTVTAELTQPSGKVVTHPLTVVREDGDWRVCGDPY
nr:hypothetical protein [Micromonospora sp. DSM 115978]